MEGNRWPLQMRNDGSSGRKSKGMKGSMKVVGLWKSSNKLLLILLLLIYKLRANYIICIESPAFKTSTFLKGMAESCLSGESERIVRWHVLLLALFLQP